MIEARNLYAGYGKRRVLSNINLALCSGDFVGLIGPNGSGKTTLIRALTGILTPASGNVFWRGRPLAATPTARFSRSVAVVSQTPELHLDMPVEEVVLLGRIPYFKRFQWWPRRRDREAVEKALGATGAEKLRRQNFQRLSGGEQQRVLLSLALAQEPRLLFLDEPTLHLDLNYQIGIFDLLLKLNRDSGLTVMTVLHDINLAAAYCRRLVFIREGQLWKEGTPDVLVTESNIRRLFRSRLTVVRHPVSGQPVVCPSAAVREADNI